MGLGCAWVALVLAQAGPLDVHGYVDAYYALNFNWPADGSNFIPGAGTSAKRANEISLNLAALDVAVKPAPLEVRPASGLIVKLEGRYDQSTAPSFSGSNDEFLAVLGTVAAF